MKIRDWKSGGGYLRGIDVSAYQGTINYAKVKSSGIKFAILRAYGSANSPDKKIVEYAKGFKNVGIPCGSYFFCTISNEYDLNSAITQANNYANKLEEAFGKGSWGQLLPFIDLENNANVGGRHANLNTTQMLIWVDQFRKTFEARFDNKVKLGIYTSWYFIKDHNNFNNDSGGNILKDMPLWMAKWRTTSIPNVGGWTNWACWQYTDNASPFANGQTVGVSSTGLDMNYVESLDHITSLNSQSLQSVLTVSRPVASLTTTNTIEVKWVAPTISGVKRLDIYRNGIKLGELPKNANYFHDRTVEYGRNYSYSIGVVTENDEAKSEVSNLVTTQTPQSDKPTGLYGQAFDRKIILTWQPNLVGEKVKGYSIYMDDKKVDYVTDNTYTFQGLINGKIYKLQVQAHNENPKPSALSDPLEIAPILKRPFPPSLLQTKVRPNGEIEVSWTYYKDEDFSHFYVVIDGRVIANHLQEEKYIIKNVEVDVEHSIYVGAVDKQGDITTSNTVTRTLHQPPQVQGLKGTPLDRRVVLEWNKPDFYHNPPLPLIPPTPPPQPEGSIFYIVQENDSIDDIAEKHGTQYSLVVAWNYDLMERSLIAGEVLYLFVDIPQGTMIHIVQQNDTFTSIATKYEMGTDELQAYNPDVDVDSLIVGSQMIVVNPTQPIVPTTIEYRTESRTRIVQKTVTETKTVATTKLIEPSVTPFDQLKQNALTLTALFETSLGFPQAYGRTAGNFDGAGMSFGAIQFNFKSNSLQPILRAMFDKHTQIVKNAFNYNSNPSYYNTVKNVVYNMSRSQQINWGASITSGTGIIQPYKDYFYNLGITPECIALQIKGAESYFNQAKNHFKKFSLTTRRAFSLCFDIAIQNWSISTTTANLIFNDFKSIPSGLSHEETETRKMIIIANRRAEASNSQWIEDVRSRKLAIAEGTGTVHGIYIDTANYDLILEPAFLEDQGTFAVPQVTYETITVEKVIEEEEQYNIQVPYVVASGAIPVGETFEEEPVILEPPTEVDKFFIYQNSELIAIVEGEIDIYEVTGLDNGATYDYSIQAISTQDLKAPISDNIRLTPITDYPNKATNLQAEIKDDRTILFSWELINSPNFSHLEVYLNGKVVSTDPTINTINYIEAKQNFDYTLEVKTYDTEGDSVTSGTITQRIDVPNIPVGLTAVPRDREIFLTWDFNEENFVKFYNIYLDGELNTVVESTQNSHTVVGLDNGIIYDFRIQAVTDRGFTSEISDAIFETPILDLPLKPTITYHKELGTGGVELNWEHIKKEGHSHYNVYRDGWLIARNITENKYMTNPLESNVTHTFQIEAFDYQGDRSGFSNSYAVTLYAKILEPLSTNLGKVDKEMPVSKPKIYLCKPNKTVIAHLNEAYALVYNTRYADLNEINFNIPYQIETTTNELIENPHYKMVKERFLIKLEYRDRTEYFIINQISNVGENNSKTIHAWSLGYELKDKLITNYKEEIWSAQSAFLFALDSTINWKIGANIKNPDFYWNREKRIFAVSNMTVLDFIIQVAKSFNAVLKWDTVNRIVDFENPMIEDVNRGLKIKYGKYLKTLSKSSSVEEMVTHLKPIGENNLTITKATINGADYLEDFSFFMQGFEMESDEFANFYLNSKAIVKDETDPYYTETMGFSSIPKGAVFLTLNGSNENVSDIISIETTAKALLTNLELFKTTQNKIYRDNAFLFADFLVNQKIEAEFEGNKFFVLPNTLIYNRTANLWEKDTDKIYLQTLYIVTSALLEMCRIEKRTEYTDLIESILSFLAFAHNNVKNRILSNDLVTGYEGLIYDHIEKISTNEDDSINYLFSWNLFDNVVIWYFAKTWKRYIELFTNNAKTDLFEEGYIPQEMLDVTLNFFNQEYQSGRILMQPSGLPYQHYHYYAVPIAKDDDYFIIEDEQLTTTFEEGIIKNDIDIDTENLTAILVTNTINGSLTLNSNGSFTYIPNLDFFGTDSFTYKLSDGINESNVATVNIHVNPLNDPPVVLNDNYIIDEDTTLTTTVANGVLANDYDSDEDLLTLTLLTTTTNGTLTFNQDGTFVYVPNANFHGVDSFTYKISDGINESETATATINVTSVNDRPTGISNWYTVNEDTVLTVTTTYSILKNDSDIEGDTLTAVLVTSTQNGSLTLNADGSFVYTPNPHFFGQDSFVYRASDGDLESTDITIYIDVKAVNDRPIATNNEYTTLKNSILETVIDTGVLYDDDDVDNEDLIAILVTTTTNGELIFNSDGSFKYTPNKDFDGEDSFSYKVSDGTLISDIANVTITVTSIQPANTFAYTVEQDETFSSIATKFSTTTTKIQELNPSVSPTNVYTGLILILPIPIFDYTVVEGDTFSSLANEYNTTVTQIQELNPTASPTNLYGGLVLKLPKKVGDYELLSEVDLKAQALLLTSQYETSREFPYSYGTTAGNFDGAGVSWGVIQYNAKTSSLIEQWQNMINYYPEVTLKAFMDNTARTPESNQANHDSWKAMMLRGDFTEILNWAEPRSDTTKNKHALIEPWNTYFMNLGITPEAIAMQKEYSSWYHQIAKQWFNDYELWSRQGYALMFDIAVQSGSMNPRIGTNPDGTPIYYDLISEINNWWTTVDVTGKTSREKEVMKLVKIANRRADYIDVSWQEQYRDRKVTVAEGYGTVNGMIMDTDGKYNMGLEPAYSTNVPSDLLYRFEKITEPPVSQADNYSVNEDTVLNVDIANGVLKNDTDVDSTNLTVFVVTSTVNGTLNLNADGSFTYTPNANFNGTDSFIYKVTDGTSESQEAVVTIKVDPIVDPQPANTVVYSVVAGDTFGDIAYRYKITSAELKALNPDILDVTLIKVGQSIYVPAPKVPNIPTNISPIDNGTSNNLIVSATVSDPDSSQVKLIVEASLSSIFTNSVIKESPMVNSGTSTSITISGLNLNSINTKIWLRIKASDGALESTIVNSSFTYSVPQPANTFIYTVVAGDTLSQIAMAHNTTTDEILALNPIVEIDNIYVGQQFYLPIVEEEQEVTLTRIYTAEANDTFSSIAIKFNTTSTHIQELNPTISPTNVYAGLNLNVPLIEYNLGYTIVSGDTISLIAKRYGTTTARIEAVNPNLDVNLIYVGQEIIVPVPCEYYTVQSYDTVATIAVDFVTTITILTEMNPNLNVNSMTGGTKILVPSFPTSEKRTIYTVVSGDSVSEIATAHNTTTEMIITLNPNIDINLIYVGQKLVVPIVTTTTETYHLLTLTELKDKMLQLTSTYETQKEYPYNFGTTAGNFDGAGISWGAIQFNAKTGPLISMWQTMINTHTTVTHNAFLANTNLTETENQTNYVSWRDMILRGDIAEITAWATPISDPATNKHSVFEPWNTYFMNLGITTEAIALQKTNAQWYYDIALSWFNELDLWSRRGYSLCFDIAVQSGSMNPRTGTDANGNPIYYDLITELKDYFNTMNITGKTTQEIETMKLLRIANRRADYIDISWQESYRDRKVAIAQGSGYVYDGTLWMDTVTFDMILEPAFADNVPTGFALEEYAEEFYFDTSQYTTEFGEELTFDSKNLMRTNNYMTEFGGELVPLSELEMANATAISPQPKNLEVVTKTFGNTSFKTENVFKITLGYAEFGLNIIAKELRTRLSNLKSENHFVNNEYVFFDRYNFDGTGNVGGDISKSLVNTGLLLQLDNYFDDVAIDDRIKETIYKYQIVSTNNNIDNGFRWNVEDTLSNISVKAYNDLINPLANYKHLGIISSSPYMSDELCKAILAYKRYLEDHEGEYQNLNDAKSLKNEELVDLQYDLTERETDLFIVQGLLDSLKAEETLFYQLVPYVGQSRQESFELKKDYTYVLLAKTSNNTISLLTNTGTKTFAENDTWQVIEKIAFDREGESTVESSINEYDYNVTLIGSEHADVEIQVNRILKQEFDTVENENDLVLKFIEEIHQNNYDQQLAIVQVKENEIANIDTEIETLRSKLSLYNNFSAELREERDLFVIAKEYIDETINNPEDLKNRALEKFDEMKKPIITIEIDVVNFLELIEEHYNWNKLDLGTLITVIYDKFDIEIEAKIIQIDYDFDSKLITLIISNINDIKTNQEKFIEAIYGAVSTSTTVSLEKHAWAKAIEVREDLDSFVNQAFDATKQKIIAGTNETIEISRRGLLIKSDVDPFNFLVANSAVLAITNDGGRSYKNAITTDGVIAQRLIGQIIAGENLIIENKTGNFRVDGEGVTIEGQALKIVGGITNEHIADGVMVDADLSGIASYYIDTYEENNQNDTIPTSPTIVENGEHIQYTEVTADLVNIAFNWQYSEDDIPENEIDGFMIYLYTSKSSALYTFGTRKKAELSLYVRPNKRSIILYNVPKDLFYNFGVEAYRYVDIELNIESVFTSPIIQITTPYNPKNDIPYDGNIMGTVSYDKVTKVNGDIVTAIRQGQSYSNVTIDSNNGIVAENNFQTHKIIINEEGFRLQKKIVDRYEDSLYATSDGTLVAEDLVANRLVINDGTGTELINAHTRQINFDQFDVVTGNIHADNIDLKGMQVLNNDGVETLSIDINGNVKLTGNITMLGGSILWETMQSTLVENTEKTGFWLEAGKLHINASHIKGGEINGDLIKAGTLEGDAIIAGTLDGDSIIAGTLTFTKSQGGQLILGGTPLGIVDGIQVYENGIFSVKDGTGEEIARLDGDYGGFGTLRIDEILDTKNVVFKTHRESENINNETGEIDYYVDPVFGNDATTTTGTADDPFLKVQTAIDRLPQYLERNVNIYYKPTLLADTSIYIEGFLGKGRIELKIWNIQVRYIRDWAFGNTKNENSHWVEVRADNVNGVLIYGNTANAPSNVVSNSGSSRTNIERVSNNNITDGYWEGGIVDSTGAKVPLYVDVYLRGIYGDMRRIKVWHYYADGRIYYGTKTEVSTDRQNWYPLFDSAREGTYKETEEGHVIYVNKANLNGFILVRHSTVPVTVRDLIIRAKGTNMPCIQGHNNTYLHVDDCLLWGDKNYSYVVYSHAGNIRVTDSELYDSAMGGVMSAYGGRLEITNCKGSGFKYGHMAHSSGFTGGAGYGLKGDTLNTYEWEGGLVKGTWNHVIGEFSPQPEAPPPPPPAPKTVTRTKTWTSTSSKTYDDGHGWWRSSDNDVLQGKWSIYGLMRGLWFFPSDMRSTCVNSTSIQKVRVYITRANKSGNGGATTHTLRTHAYASRPSGRPLLSGATQTFVLSRGQGAWIDITGTFKNIFKQGSAWGIGMYTPSTNSTYYSRCTTVAKIEITYTENV